MDMNNVNLDEQTVNIEEYNQTTAALALLTERYETVPDAATEEGYGELKSGIKELTGLRSAIEKARKREKEPHLEAGKLIDSEAKRITGALEQIEQPLRLAKTAQDEIEAKKKADRIARLQIKVDAIRSIATRAKGKTAAEISDLLDSCGEICVDHDFYDLTDEARKAQDETLETLAGMLGERVLFERSEAERIALEAKTKAQNDELEAMRAKMAELEQQNNKLAATVEQAKQEPEPAQPIAQPTLATAKPAPAPERAAPAPSAWSASVERPKDMLALVQAVANGDAPLELLRVNTTLLAQMAADLGASLNIPGVTVRQDKAAA
jgi:hypothetical protein